MHFLRILLFSAAHFAVAMLIAIIAFGLDMDQLQSRSVWSRAASAIHNVLWLPHDAAIGAIPNAWLIRHTYIIPLAVAANSLAWGTVLFALWRLSRLLRRRSPAAHRERLGH